MAGIRIKLQAEALKRLESEGFSRFRAVVQPEYATKPNTPESAESL